MKTRNMISLVLFGLACLCPAVPTEQRQWTATNGKTVTGKALGIDGGKVQLERDDGKVVNVPLTIFVSKDQAFLEEHFEIIAGASAQGSGASPATGLPHPQGEIVGPVEVGPGCSYKLYLPKSLKEGRKAPLLFITNSAGKDVKRMTTLANACEMAGWAHAVSMESGRALGYDGSAEICKQAVEHLVQTLPVDPDRVYFAGGSTGGAQALINSSKIKAAGVIPWVTYVATSDKPKANDYFIIGGAEDLNRYCTADSANELGRNAKIVFHPGGHTAPTWTMEDAILWMNAKFLSRNKRECADEAQDFEQSMIHWLEELKEVEPYRAYSTALFLKNDYKISGSNAQAVDRLIGELGTDEKNVRYHEGMAEIEGFSRRKLSKAAEKGKTKVGHVDPSIERAALELAKKYEGVPVIEDVFNGFASPTK